MDGTDRRTSWGAWWTKSRPRLDDLALSSITLIGALFLIVDAEGNELLDASVWVGAALTVAMAVALWWRRRRPLVLVVAGCLIVALGASWVVLSVTLATLAVRRRDRVLVVASVAAVVARLVASSPYGAPSTVGGWVTSQVIFLSVFVLLPVVFGAFIGARRDLLASLLERAARAEAEQQLRAEQARAAERTRIAREMHDVLGHRISLVALHAGGLEVSAIPPQAVKSAELIRTTAREALDDLRDILGVLREGTGEAADGGATSPEGLSPDLLPSPDLRDLPALVLASAQAGTQVRLIDEMPSEAVVPALIGRTAYRVVQESLTNVHKHAAHAETTVSIGEVNGGFLAVEVANSRPLGSFDREMNPGSGFGLVGLRERVHLADGQLEAAATSDGGFLVRARLPWPTVQDIRG